jgi:nicotinamide riboside kinase
MAAALATALATVWVPEYGRWYWEGRRYLTDQSWASDEFRRIATAQQQLEDNLARRSPNGLVIADTDAMVTAVWHERYVGRSDPTLESMVPAIVPAMYLVCHPDFEWVQDGTRESREHRRRMHDAMVDRAEKSGAQVEHLTGSHEKRLARALDVIRPLSRFPKLL